MTTGVILGAAVWETGPSPTLIRRTRHAAQLFHAGRVEHLIACGGLGRHPPTEAEAMRLILLAEGVPDAAITLEDTSTTTAENLRNAAPLVPGDKIVIISDRYHLPRACLMARRLGLQATGDGPSARGARLGQQVKSTLREVPAYLLYWLRFR